MGDEMILTIAIPTFNRDVWLDNSLRLLIPEIKEIGFGVELVISNNASNDRTDEVVRKYENDFPIIYNKNKENIGAIRNINKCLCMSNSKFIWVLGDDDFIEIGFLRKCLDIIKNNCNIPFFFIDMRIWYPNRKFQFGDDINAEINIERIDYNNIDLKYMKYDKLEQIATFEKGYFNAISNYILLKDDYINAFKIGVDAGKEFTSIETTFPHSYYIAKNMLNMPCIEICSSGLVCSYAVSWKKYYDITWLKWFPELIILMTKNGADKNNAINGRKCIINSKYPVMIPNVLKKEIAHYEYFSYFEFIKENFWIKDFWLVIFKVIKRQIKLYF